MDIKIRSKRGVNNIIMWHVFAKIVREQCTVCCHVADADAYGRIASIVGGEFNPNGVADSVERAVSEHTYAVIAVGLEFGEVPSLVQLVVRTSQYTVLIVKTTKSIVLVAVPSDER